MYTLYILAGNRQPGTRGINKHKRNGKMRSHIKRWGNSFGIRIPKSIMDDLELKDNEELEITMVNGTITLKPVKRKKFSLDALLNGVTRENIHDEIETGSPQGKEAW